MKPPWGDLPEPVPGTYAGLADFIAANKLTAAFTAAITSDPTRTVEDYVGEYGASKELTQRVIGDISTWKWNKKIAFHDDGSLTVKK